MQDVIIILWNFESLFQTKHLIILITIVNMSEPLLYARHYAKRLYNYLPFIPHNKPMSWPYFTACFLDIKEVSKFTNNSAIQKQLLF